MKKKDKIKYKYKYKTEHECAPYGEWGYTDFFKNEILRIFFAGRAVLS